MTSNQEMSELLSVCPAFSMNSYALFGLPDASALAFLRVVECFF
jgi:hypothetical protein